MDYIQGTEEQIKRNREKNTPSIYGINVYDKESGKTFKRDVKARDIHEALEIINAQLDAEEEEQNKE